MLLATSLRVHSLNLKVHAGGAHRPASLLIKSGYHAGIVLSYRRRHLVKVTLRGTVRSRLDLEVVVSTLTLEVELCGHILGAAHWVVDLQVLQGHFFVLLLLVLC